MPRVARPRDAGTANSPLRSPGSIPLNNDRIEKAARLHSRQAVQEAHLNHIRVANSPGSRRSQFEKGRKDIRHHGAALETWDPKGEQSWAGLGATGSAASHRVPILANFEEWMKMATDNKINATNSWNFALIDYFHDMSLLKDGDSVNFQKASCTLDGCVKIYTSRVDSVATETGKLLSGLADSTNKNQRGNSGDNDDGDADLDDEDEEEGRKKSKKRSARSSDDTLVPSFAQIQIKKFELEFSVDPLFKKASADFDEGGAKGLLLNHLCTDANGRIVFDSSDEPQEAGELHASGEDSTETSTDASNDVNDGDIDISDLKREFFPDLLILEEHDICPSLKTLEVGDTMDLAGLGLMQDHKRKDIADSLKNPSAEDDAGLLALGNDDTEIGFDLGFGTGGDVWAHEAGLEANYDNGADSQYRDGSHTNAVHAIDGDETDAAFGVRMHFGTRDFDQPNILGYFDNSAKSNWAGPEHWKIRKMKKDITSREAPKRKEKEPFEIDFQSPLTKSLAEQIYTSASSNSVITLPKSQWRSKTRYLLPDDKHFNSTHLLRLFLKPRARLGQKGARTVLKTTANGNEPRHVEDSYWATSQGLDDGFAKSDFDADFFREDETTYPMDGAENDGDEFADAREAFSPAFGHDDQTVSLSAIGGDITNIADAGYGSSLVTKSKRSRPEYVSYAKVAKKVDVRLLKEKMWNGIGFREQQQQQQQVERNDTSSINDSQIDLQSSKKDDDELLFTSVINDLQKVYTTEAMAEISTSYCFISLLHLANEKGLILNNENGLEELKIRRDASADLVAAAA